MPWCIYCKQVQVLACNAIQFNKEEGAMPGKQETQAFVPIPLSRDTNLLKPVSQCLLNGDNKASQGFLVREGEVKKVNTCESVLESTGY